MTERAIFNRRYTSYTPGSTTVWLVNGGGVSTIPSSTEEFTVGAEMDQGSAVYVSGSFVFPATALSGQADFKNKVIGFTSEYGYAASGVAVNLDGVVVIQDKNITADVALITGEKYYLSKYTGQITRFSTASGVVSNSGDNQYQVLAPVGTALSTSELKVEIQPTVILYS